MRLLPSLPCMDLTQYIRDVEDFPKPGITFKDITPLLSNHKAMDHAIGQLSERFGNQGITKIAGIESRGFIFAPPLALALGCGFVPVRKPGKLPWRCRSVEYDLEYGSDKIEIHEDAVSADDKVLIIDDLLATGGTMAAAISLVQDLGAEVYATACIINLNFLGGGEKIDTEHHGLINYD